MAEREDCLNLEDLKKEYVRFKEEYNLPEFSDLNKVFDIEDIDADSEYLLRKIRRVISERVSGYLRFIETILNPSNAPMFFFKLIKRLDESDKTSFSEVYETLGKLEVEILMLDIDYFEEKEAEFIKKVFNVFDNEIKGKLLMVVKKMREDNGTIKKASNGDYVG